MDLQASLILDTVGRRNSVSSITWTVSDLDTTPTLVSNPVPNNNTDDDTVTGSSDGASGAFAVTFTSAIGWVAADAQTAITGGTFETYVSGLTGATITTLANPSGWGVNDSKIGDGEVLIMTWDTSSLTGNSAISLTDVGYGLTGGTDQIDFIIWDASADVAVVNQQNIGLAATNPQNVFLESGDLVVIGALESDFRFNTLTVTAVPEPSTILMLSGLLFVCAIFGRRRGLIQRRGFASK